MKPHLRRVLPVTAAEAAAKIEVRPHNTMNWDISVIDTSASGFCAQAKIIADLPAYPDRQCFSPRVCGHQQGTTWRAGKNESSTFRGVKVQVCRVHSDGSDQHCETKQYIPNADRIGTRPATYTVPRFGLEWQRGLAPPLCRDCSGEIGSAQRELLAVEGEVLHREAVQVRHRHELPEERIPPRRVRRPLRQAAVVLTIKAPIQRRSV
jgi:hypothetical protein